MDNLSPMVGANLSEDRREADFYPTPPECTVALMQFLEEQGILSSEWHNAPVIWEPACGEGAISNILKMIGFKVISSDLRDTGYGKQVNFLQYRSPVADVLITNPPFFHAQAFIEHAMKLDLDIVVLLLKSTYFHAGGRVDLFRKHRPSWVLPMAWKPNFNPAIGKSGLMDFTWFVWEKGVTETRYEVLEKPVSEEE